MEKDGKLIQECLITTGATAAFPDLIKSAVSHASLQAFVDCGFTHITYQCGKSLSVFEKWKPVISYGLVLRAFDFNTEGLSEEMRRCQASSVSRRGLVICHAGLGAGTVLEALRFGIQIIVVPNNSLLGCHQEELADELERQGYATKSGVEDLSEAIQAAYTKEIKAWTGRTASLVPIINETIGYEEDVKAHLD